MRDLQLLSFERGIERVHWSAGDYQARLPEQSDAVLPSDAAPQPHLDALFPKKDLDNFLKRAIDQATEHRRLLIPTVFQQTLEDVVKDVIARAQNFTDLGEDEAMMEFLSLMQDESEILEMLAHYRAVLQRG